MTAEQREQQSEQKADVALNRYVALLRAVNVGGHSVIRMDELRKVSEESGLLNVTTYAQSGNVVFDSPDPDPALPADRLRRHLTGIVGCETAVFVVTPRYLADAAAHNPFGSREDQSCYLMFLSAKPTTERYDALIALQGTEYRFHIWDRVLYYAYSVTPTGHRRHVDFEKALGVTGTARSSNVVERLIDLARAAP